jgi:hypothetical protein
MEQILLNVIPFTPIQDKLTFAFYGDKVPGGASIKWDKLFEEFPEDRDPQAQSYYSDFQPAREGAIVKEIDVFNAIKFTQHYYRYLILNHFKSIEGSIVFSNFTRDVEVWFQEKSFSNLEYKLYNKFTLKVQYKNVANSGYELMLAYNGTSKVWQKPIADIVDYDDSKYTLVIHKGIIYNHEKMPPELKQDIDNIFPILNNEIKKDWDIDEERKIENRYPIFLAHLQNFYKTYLKTKEFNSIIQLAVQGFYIVPDKKVFRTSLGSNELQFRDGTHINPFLGINEHKPLKSYTEKPVKFFFIYHKDDRKMIGDTFYEYITKGWHKEVDGVMKHTKTLKRFINQDYSIDKVRSISFNDTNTIFEELEPVLKDLKEDPHNNWIAIYFTPIHKSAKEHPQHNAYYKIKELLLEKNISSQVIYKEHLTKEDFYYFISNISVALLAKIGGVPWRLARDPEDEVIIGIGAFKPKGSAHRFVGSAFCFDNTGNFEGFDCFRDDETTMLAGSIRDAVEKFIEKKKEPSRIIIHFYKEISDRKELKPILEMLKDVSDRDIPVIVVTINKTDSHELIGFDMKARGKMPVSGTFVSVGFNRYLLFNNVRYGYDATLGEKDFHFPIKLSIKASQDGVIDDPLVLKQLVDQVYQFSRMYWKSISQQNLPVTTRYPEMVAEIYPHFANGNLPEFGKKNLWFL